MTPLARLLDPALVEALGRLNGGTRRTALGVAGGPHKSPFKGASVEFRQHRMYVPGDDVRRLDWRVLARTDRPFVREYDDETTLRTVVAVDASGSMAYGGRASKLDDAKRVAAAIAYVALAGGESAGLLVAGPTPGGATRSAWVPPAAAATQLARVVEILSAAEAAGETTIDHALAAHAGGLGRRALVVVVSDLLLPPERLRRTLARLRHDRHGIVVVRVRHPHESAFPFRGYVRFRGSECERPVLAQAAAVRAGYLGNLAAHDRSVRVACQGVGADVVEHAVGSPLIDTLRRVVRGAVRRGRP